MPGPTRQCAALVAELSGTAWNQRPVADGAVSPGGAAFLAAIAETVTMLRGRVLRAGPADLVATFPLADSGFSAATRMLNAALREGFEVRAGLHFLAVGEAGETEAADRASGEAARICRMAGPGELLLTSATLPYLCGHFRDQCVRIGTAAAGRSSSTDELYACKKQAGDETVLGEEHPLEASAGEEKVLLLSRGDQEFFVTMQSGPITIGRAPDSHIVLENSRCSRKHAVIETGRNRFLLRDQSTNGTFLFESGGECHPVHRDAAALSGEGTICFGDRSAGAGPDTLTYRVVDSPGE